MKSLYKDSILLLCTDNHVNPDASRFFNMKCIDEKRWEITHGNTTVISKNYYQNLCRNHISGKPTIKMPALVTL